MIQPLLDSLCLALVAAGAAVLGLSLTSLARLRSEIPLAIEFWTAAALLRLATQVDWPRLATAAAIVAVRKLILARTSIDLGR